MKIRTEVSSAYSRRKDLVADSKHDKLLEKVLSSFPQPVRKHQILQALDEEIVQLNSSRWETLRRFLSLLRWESPPLSMRS